jgi:hypothetical protein
MLFFPTTSRALNTTRTTNFVKFKPYLVRRMWRLRQSLLAIRWWTTNTVARHRLSVNRILWVVLLFNVWIVMVGLVVWLLWVGLSNTSPEINEKKSSEIRFACLISLKCFVCYRGVQKRMLGFTEKATHHFSQLAAQDIGVLEFDRDGLS